MQMAGVDVYVQAVGCRYASWHACASPHHIYTCCAQYQMCDFRKSCQQHIICTFLLRTSPTFAFLDTYICFNPLDLKHCLLLSSLSSSAVRLYWQLGPHLGQSVCYFDCRTTKGGSIIDDHVSITQRVTASRASKHELLYLA